MSLHECTGAGCVAKPEAIAELLDGRPISIGLVAELEKNRLLAARMLDQLRFQHEVLAEIHDLVSSASAGDSHYRLNLISIKAAVAARAAANSGLLS